MNKGFRDSLKLVERTVKQTVKQTAQQGAIQGIKKGIRRGVRKANDVLNSVEGGKNAKEHSNGNKDETHPSSAAAAASPTSRTASAPVDRCEETPIISATDGYSKTEQGSSHHTASVNSSGEDNTGMTEGKSEDSANQQCETDMESSVVTNEESSMICPDNNDKDVKVQSVQIPEGPVTFEYFRDWTNRLEQTLSLPTFHEETWKTALQGYQQPKNTLEQARKALEKAKKDKESDERIAELTQKVQEEKAKVEEALKNCQNVASSLLNAPEMQNFLNENQNNDNWVIWTVLKSVAPKTWAEWCNRDSQSMLVNIITMLNSPDFLLEILQEGGPRGRNYRNFLKIFKDIGPQKNSLLQRLAMAVALEFANDDYCIFDTKTKIDPVQRFVHYEQAFLMGELDPAFPTLGVWDLRMAVNSDASNEELSWGRQKLMNYRPDHILSRGYDWRYCFAVKSDVGYNAPEWYKKPRTYDQILSGGGKCGPRAWYGRFMCKAFGIPTWGIRQPGHAAMTHWTPNEWVICLGGNNWQVSYWEERCALNFKVETKARKSCASPALYQKLVQKLEWAAMKKGETRKSVINKHEISASEPWAALGLFQSEIVGSTAQASVPAHQMQSGSENVVASKIERLLNEGDPGKGNPSWNDEKDKLIIPADCSSKPNKTAGKVVFMKSFSGGRQVFLKEDGVVEYTLKPELLFPDEGRVAQVWKLSFQVCTVHRAETDLVVTCASDPDNGSKKSYNIPLPYTMGEWQTTEPVTIELGADATKMSLTRAYKKYGISLKDIILCPMY